MKPDLWINVILLRPVALSRSLSLRPLQAAGAGRRLVNLCAFDKGSDQGWGYTVVHDEETFLDDYRRIMEAVYASEALHGFCYTQLSDVEQEINGLLTYDREPKCDVDKIKEINDMYHLNVVTMR